MLKQVYIVEYTMMDDDYEEKTLGHFHDKEYAKTHLRKEGYKEFGSNFKYNFVKYPVWSKDKDGYDYVKIHKCRRENG